MYQLAQTVDQFRQEARQAVSSSFGPSIDLHPEPESAEPRYVWGSAFPAPASTPPETPETITPPLFITEAAAAPPTASPSDSQWGWASAAAAAPEAPSHDPFSADRWKSESYLYSTPGAANQMLDTPALTPAESSQPAAGKEEPSILLGPVPVAPLPPDHWSLQRFDDAPAPATPDAHKPLPPPISTVRPLARQVEEIPLPVNPPPPLKSLEDQLFELPPEVEDTKLSSDAFMNLVKIALILVAVIIGIAAGSFLFGGRHAGH